MPPGRGDVMRDQSAYFDQVVQRYRTTIAGQFYGHTHADEFAVGYANYSERTAENAVSVAMIGPAMTPMSEWQLVRWGVTAVPRDADEGVCRRQPRVQGL